MSAKPNTYSNRFSKALERGREDQTEDSQPNGSAGNVFPFQRKIGATVEEEKSAANGVGAAVSTSGRLTQPPGFAQLIETWSIGKPTITTEKIEETSSQAGKIQTRVAPKAEPEHSGKQTPDYKVVEIHSEKVEPHLVAIRHPRSPHCEEYRNLRTQLLHTAERRRLQGQVLQAIVIASTRPGEGKTTTALNLAWLLAQTDGVSALIIDSDLRMPSIADYLGIEDRPGLSDVFDGSVELEDAIVRLEPSGLHVLPGGAARDDVAELLSGNAFRQIMDKARTMFDYIIIDAPPLGIFTDAAVLINRADGAMIVVKAGRTRYGKINQMLENLPRERMLGVVLNGCNEELSESHYSYYYSDSTKKKSSDEQAG